MEIFGLSISRAQKKSLSPPDNRGGWWPIVREPFAGAWQRDLEQLNPDQCLSFNAIFACHTLICSDVSKLRIRLVQLMDGVWQEVNNPAYSPVLRKPNHFQNSIQFLETWMNSKLLRGNAYVLKRRDGRGVVTALYVLNPDRVQPLVSDDGQIFYRLSQDNLSAITDSDMIVPAREIIHDRFNTLWHPLVGISPLYANALLATKAINIETAAAQLAANGIRPGGLLIYPGNINPDEAARVKDTWQTQYAGPKGAQRLAILGNGAKFEAMTMTSVDAQVVEQLKYTAEMVCSAYHVPSYKIGAGVAPTYNNIQSLNIEYFSQCLQVHLQQIEACLDDGLGMGANIGTDFDVENLLRMDSATQMEMLNKSAGILEIDEMRAKLSLAPTEGGNAVYLQEQNFSLPALAKRDALDDPFAHKSGTSPNASADAVANDNAQAEAKAIKEAGPSLSRYLGVSKADTRASIA